jgi:hypothetical protein
MCKPHLRLFSRALDPDPAFQVNPDPLRIRGFDDQKPKKKNNKIRVADPGCLSLIPDPDFYPSRIPDPKTATKERGEKKFVVIPFL